MIDRLKRNLRLLMIVRQVPLSQLAKRAGDGAKTRVKKLAAPVTRSRIAQTKVRVLDRMSGPQRGNAAFWQSRLALNWPAAEERLFRFSETGQTDALNDFVRTGLLNAPGSTTMMFMARSGLTRDRVTAHLRDTATLAQLVSTAQKSSNFAAGLVSIAAHLLDGDDLAAAMAAFRAAGLRPNPNHIQLVDSFATVPSQKPDLLAGTVAAAPTRKPARHRLVIANSLKDPTRLSLLFSGAEKVTLFSPSNLYGRTTLGDSIRLHARPAEILIAHPRSRATRFSHAYHALHDETRLIAEEVVDEIDCEVSGYLAEAKPYLALHLADALFFKGLPVVGMRELILDEDFDQVIIVGGDDADDSFWQLMSGVSGLQSDPRVEFVSVARRERARAQFARTLSRAFHMPEALPQTLPAFARQMRDGFDDLRDEVQPVVAKLKLWPTPAEEPPQADARPRVLFVTGPIPTYNSSSAAYSDILLRNFDTLMAVIGQNLGAIFKNVPDLPLPPTDRVQLMGAQPRTSSTVLEYGVQHVLERVALRHRGPQRLSGTAHILLKESLPITRNTVIAGLYHWERLLQWFARMQAADQKPAVVAISPYRPALFGMVAAAARRFAIPSIALEPHTINAEYCRYCRVMTDRYGTISSYLAKLAETGFSIPADRIDIIGSPRLVAQDIVPPDAARQQLEADGLARFPTGSQTLVFFSQPSKWAQISEVWQMILTAMAPCDNMQVLLKVHPEEGELRIAAYLSLAESMGLKDRVQCVAAAPARVIEAADLVLACYSTTLVEAALAGRPVYSVVDKGGHYPIDQHEVVGAPQYDDVADLTAAFARFSADPTEDLARVTRFLQANPQLVDGPEPHLTVTINAMAKADPAQVLRPAQDLPPRLFIEGPYRVYDI